MERDILYGWRQNCVDKANDKVCDIDCYEEGDKDKKTCDEFLFLGVSVTSMGV